MQVLSTIMVSNMISGNSLATRLQLSKNIPSPIFLQDHNNRNMIKDPPNYLMKNTEVKLCVNYEEKYVLKLSSNFSID